MKSNNAIMKLKRGLTMGVGILALVAYGCGGGGGTGVLTSTPTLTITPGTATAASISRVGSGTRKVVGAIASSATLKVFSLDGKLLSGPTNVTLPVDLTLNTTLVSSAAAQGLLVACVDDGAGLSYKTIVKLNASDLATNGPIQSGGANREEPTDVSSTVVATLIEAELEQATGAAVQTCQELSAGTSAKLKALVEGSTDGIAIDEMAAALKVAAADPTSLVNDIITATAAGVTPAATADASSEIRRYMRTGRTRTGTGASSTVRGQLRNARKLMRATTKLARQSRSQGNATRKAKVTSFITEIAKATPATATAKAAGAALVADTLEIAAKATGQTTLANAINSVIDGATNLDTVAESTATNVLPQITADVAVALEDAGVLDEFSGVVGNVVGGATNESSIKAALGTLDTALKVIKSSTKKNKLLGGALAASSDDKAAVGRIMVQAATVNNSLAVEDRVDVASAVRVVAKDEDAGSDAGDILVAITEAIADLGSAALAGAFSGDATADALVGSLINDLDGEEILVVNDSGSGVTTIPDEARISGAINVRAGDGVLFFNDSIETGAGVYSYAWTVATAAASGAVVQNNDFLAFTAGTAATYTITLAQTTGTTTKTATVSLTITDAAAKLSAIVDLSDSGLTLEQGGSGSLDINIIDPETGRTLTNTVTVGDCNGFGAVTGLTGPTNPFTGTTITVSATTAVAGGAYCGRIVSSASDGAADAVATFDITVEVPAATQVFISGANDGTVGTAVTVTASALKETTTTETLSLSILSGSSVMASSSLTLTAAGFFSVTATLPAAATVGAYTASASAGAGSDSASFSLNEAGAPTITSMKVNGIPVFSGDAISFVTSTSNFWVDFDVMATSSTAITSYWVTASHMSSSMSSGTADGQNMKVWLSASGHPYTVTVVATDGSKQVQASVTITVNQKKDIEVTHVTLEGTIGTAVISATSIASAGGTTMTTSYMNSMYMVDATNVSNLDLNTTTGNTLWFYVYTETPNSNDVSGSFVIEIAMADANTTREATLRVEGASISLSNGGYDINQATSFAFHGMKADGTVADVTVTSISTLDALFGPVTDGLKFNLLQLREAMRSIITTAGKSGFASTFDDMNGSGISVMVTITGDNFNFTTGGNSFNSFKITNITVN